MSAELHEIADARNRAAIDRAVESIRSCGFTVSFIESRGAAVVIDAHNGEGDCYRMLVDPAHVRRDGEMHLVGQLLDE